MAKHNILGSTGEQLATAYLEEKGFAILERNWRHRKAEVDLIAIGENRLVIVEVKTRATVLFGQPEEFVNSAKQKLLAEAANAYLELNELNYEVRFDIISVISNESQTSVHHIKDAFYPFADGTGG